MSLMSRLKKGMTICKISRREGVISEKRACAKFFKQLIQVAAVLCQVKKVNFVFSDSLVDLVSNPSLQQLDHLQFLHSDL